jgi:hypothetical protein
VAYEIFERNSVRVESPTLTVRPEGRIACNAAASRFLKNAGVTSVRILWDKNNCGIALLATDIRDDNSYSVVFSPSRSAIVSAKAFLRHIGWSSNRRQTVPATWDRARRMLEAELPIRFVSSVSLSTPSEELVAQKKKDAVHRSPGAHGNIRDWIALNETLSRREKD